jgi:hypothetical protein
VAADGLAAGADVDRQRKLVQGPAGDRGRDPAGRGRRGVDVRAAVGDAQRDLLLPGPETAAGERYAMILLTVMPYTLVVSVIVKVARLWVTTVGPRVEACAARVETAVGVAVIFSCASVIAFVAAWAAVVAVASCWLAAVCAAFAAFRAAAALPVPVARAFQVAVAAARAFCAAATLVLLAGLRFWAAVTAFFAAATAVCAVR